MIEFLSLLLRSIESGAMQLERLGARDAKHRRVLIGVGECDMLYGECPSW